MKKLVILCVCFFIGCKKQGGIQIDLSKSNDTVTAIYTNLSDSIYVLNGILCRAMDENEKLDKDGKSRSLNVKEGTPMIFYNEENQPPYVKKITYDKNKSELTLQKIRDSIYNKPLLEEHLPFESILILYPKTTKTVYFKLNRNSNKHHLQMFDYYTMGTVGRHVFERISPVLKNVNTNYYLYKYRFNTRSDLKINLK